MRQLNGGVFLLSLMALCLLLPVAAGAAQPPTKDDVNKKEYKEAQEERDAYAAHIYSSGCYANGKGRIGMQFKKTSDPQKDLEGVEKACDCMASSLVKEVGGDKLMDYIVFINGARSDKGSQNGVNSLFLSGASKTSKTHAGMKTPTVKGLPKELAAKITMGIPDQIKSIGEFERNPDNRKKCGYLR